MTERFYEYGRDGLVRAGGAVTDDGDVVLGFGFGPRAENEAGDAKVSTAWNSTTLIE